mmetsp:Transcript_15558/g.22974  ORF Transcript_15558/g.22974 Transcript_15558/m.22974 type:complete len:96 (+) Transcript_15558:85-372(+)
MVSLIIIPIALVIVAVSLWLLKRNRLIFTAEEASIEDELRKSLCLNCNTRRRNIVFLPCKHLCYCECCSKDVVECPMCTKPVTQRIHIHVNYSSI